MRSFDAVIVGAGHNELAAAVHLRKLGWSVAVLEGASDCFASIFRDHSFKSGRNETRASGRWRGGFNRSCTPLRYKARGSTGFPLRFSALSIAQVWCDGLRLSSIRLPEWPLSWRSCS